MTLLQADLWGPFQVSPSGTREGTGTRDLTVPRPLPSTLVSVPELSRTFSLSHSCSLHPYILQALSQVQNPASRLLPGCTWPLLLTMQEM